MPAKKPAARKARARKRGGLTSALGPKATTALVVCVLAGGLVYGARQQEEEQKKLKAKEAAAAMMAPDGPADDAVMKASTPSSKALASNKVASKTVASAATSSASTPVTHAVTVTGCLEKSDDGYRLKDTSGVAAPKSRSWKSGFLKKGAAPVDVVDASHTLALNRHVGHRVAVSGPLTDREMRAESVQQVAASCRAN
jgi:hypothetical protein